MNDRSEEDIQIKGEHLYSARFDDHYASRVTPEAEKFTVFCEGNQLPRRFQSVERFCIGELGFGSGLGFLVTAKLWLETAPAHAQLDFISVEGYPLTTEQLTLAQSAFPELADISRALITAYPSDNRGFHRLNLFDDRIRLTLLFTDVLDAFDQLEASVDAWYLDGFAPAKNPEMWRPDIFRAMNRLSNNGASFATYTAAGQVRRDLMASGFEVKKIPGFAHKRERLAGQLSQRLNNSVKRFPWKQRSTGIEAHEEITILGGGIAGCALANRLAARGKRVTILEKEQQLAGGASSNPVAITHPHFTADQNLTSQLALQGYLYTLQTVDRLEKKGLETGFKHTGMVVLPKSDKDRFRHEKIVAVNPPSEALGQWLSAQQLSQITDTTIASEGWSLPQSGWLSLALTCHALVNEYADSIQVKAELDVADIRYENGCWHLLDQQNNSLHETNNLVLANAFDMRHFGPVAHLPLRPNRGQVNYAYAPDHGIHHTLCAKGYLAPLDKDHLCFGSSYAPGDPVPRVTPEDHQSNEDQLRAAFPGIASTIEEDSLGWSGVRTILADRMPAIGQVAQVDTFKETYGPMYRGEIRHHFPDPPHQPGLFVYTGLGSRSVAYSIICGEALAAEITRTALPLPRRVRDAMDANRFILKMK